MMRKTALLVFVVWLTACQSNKKEVKPEPASATCAKDSTATKSKFQMYEMSEMSLLMEQMYVDNQRLKARIQEGDTIGKFPNHFLKIHRAVMTDDKENDAFFKLQAAQFIHAQEMIYQDPKNAKEHFNKGVDACLQCHKVKCAGPIPRIKKLYID